MLVVDVIAVGNYICSSRACDEIRWCRQKETVVGWIGIHIGQMAQCLRNPATERRDIKKEEKKKRRKEEKKKRRKEEKKKRRKEKKKRRKEEKKKESKRGKTNDETLDESQSRIIQIMCVPKTYLHRKVITNKNDLCNMKRSKDGNNSINTWEMTK
eukprot:TRINITY_DN264_c0_g1_i10.p1 TRINITY_DN264_c0_g1~~TRINITY_DN264_c0_g1_i10.p1  ORF type:complete len:156 (-),score=36.49 TRINITY_DN264_c0_g1_i10:72-539(-)